jgi:hypothetical protein
MSLSKHKIKLHFQNGLDLKTFKKEVFDIEGVSDEFDFEESTEPDFIIFGPYGNDIPTKGNYTRIGYYCENIVPDMAICEWAFGVPHDAEVNNPHYKRIQWHGTAPSTLIKPATYNAEEIAGSKKYFCNFLYSHKVSYREEFFRQLSKYKKVDAPGKSMNNMAGIDTLYQGDIWQRKRQFLSSYKFTIAFENYVYPGYQTEKLYDAMQANSIPIYCGDPHIDEIFNTRSFINVADYIKPKSTFANWLQKNSQMDFVDMRPQFYHNPAHRIKRKLKAIGRNWKMNLQLGDLDFGALTDRIIELDKDDDKYLEMLKQPWFKNNEPPANASNKTRWIEIFNKENVS